MEQAMPKTLRWGWLLAAAVPLSSCGKAYPCEKGYRATTGGAARSFR